MKIYFSGKLANITREICIKQIEPVCKIYTIKNYSKI